MLVDIYIDNYKYMDYFCDCNIVFSAEEIYGDVLNPKKYRVEVSSDGTVYYYTAGKMTTFCLLDLTYFPFDAQACYIELSSWTYDETQVVFFNSSDQIETKGFRPNGQWQLTQEPGYLQCYFKILYI